MTTPTNPQEPFAPWLPNDAHVPEEQDRLRSYLVDSFSRFKDVINDKKIGVIVQNTEVFNGERWWYLSTKVNRNGYTAIAYIPSYPNSDVKTLDLNSDPQYPIPNVNPEFVITELYGTASKPCSAVGAGDGDFIKYNNRGDPRIFFDMSDTVITITTTIDLRTYSGFIFISYLRNGL